MLFKNKKIAILFHFLIALLSYVFPIGIGFYFMAFVIYSIRKILITSDYLYVAGQAALYIVTMEIMLRVAKISILPYESGKYAVSLILFLGVLMHKKESKQSAFHIIIYIFLLLPSILLVDLESIMESRKAILFNLSGPLSLTFSVFYFYKRKISYALLKHFLFVSILPIITLAVYLFTYTNNINIKYGLTASKMASGGFGPNQVSTILGWGILVFLFGFIMKQAITYSIKVDIFIFLLIVFRALLTFSRGGFIAPILSLFVATSYIVFYYPSFRKKITSVLPSVFGIVFLLSLSFFIVNEITNNFLILRYSGETTLTMIGKSNERNFVSSRDELALSDLKYFFDNPFMGVGVGMLKVNRVRSGKVGNSHTEFTRLLGEHGILGLFSLLILLLSPIIFLKQLRNVNNIFFTVSLLILSLFTMSHSAMRLSFSGVLYGFAFILLYRDNTFYKGGVFKKKSII